MRRIILVGATGVFGSRLAAMLCAIPDIEIVLAARDVEAITRLQAVLRTRNDAATLSIQTFDRTRPETLVRLDPWLVVDAAGPFQESGYGLAMAAVRAGAHYVDVADARAFVAGFAEALQPAALEAGVFAVTGASSTPALSHAALATLTEGWRRTDKVCVAISPGARAPRGLSVLQSILSYVGQPIRVFRGGRWILAPGWSGLRRLDMPRLGRRWASLCETPDLDLLPARFPIRRDALFMAGLELAPMHLGLTALGLLVRWRLVRRLTPLARPLRIAAGCLAPFGTDRGGMIVEAEGEDRDGRAIRARWALRAEANAGPNTPAAPAAAVIRALIDGRERRHGAFVCAGDLDVGDILRELAAFPIATRIDEGHPDDPILFRRLLGRRFEALPEAIRAVHGARTGAIFTGRAITHAGRGSVARLVRRVIGLPPSGRCDVDVCLVPDKIGETWTRRFGATRFASRLVDTGRLGVFEERFGPLRFVFDLQPTARGVVWRAIGWSVGGVPLPLSWAPKMHARADEVEGRYRFRVVVAHPWIGLLFAYRGELGRGPICAPPTRCPGSP